MRTLRSRPHVRIRPLRFVLAACAALLAIWPPSVRAQDAQPSDDDEPQAAIPAERIASVNVRGNRRTSAADVLATLEERVGAPFDPGTLRRDVRALWELGFFDDVQVEADHVRGGIALTFVVRER